APAHAHTPQAHYRRLATVPAHSSENCPRKLVANAMYLKATTSATGCPANVKAMSALGHKRTSALFDHFVGERNEHWWNANAERFDVQSKVQTCFACSIRCIFVTQGCDLVKCRQRSSRGDFLMRLSSAIRAALMALTVTGTGLATAAHADSGSMR